MIILHKKGDTKDIKKLQAYQCTFSPVQTAQTDIAKTNGKRFLVNSNQENRPVSEKVTPSNNQSTNRKMSMNSIHSFASDASSAKKHLTP